MNQSIDEILNGPDYFRCDRYRVRMKKAECVRRQTEPERGFEIDYTYTICKDCEQGKEIKVEAKDWKPEPERRRPPRMDIIEKVEAQRALSADDEPKEEEQKMVSKKQCIVVGCKKNRSSRGLCSTHYYRWSKGIDKTIEPLPPSRRFKRSPKVKTDPIPSEIVQDEVEVLDSNSNVIPVPEIDNSDVFRQAARAFLGNIERKFMNSLLDEMGGAAKTLDSGSSPE